MAPKLNHRVRETLNKIINLEPGKKLTITCNGNNFQLFFKGEQISGDLTLADLRNISKHATKLKIVQLVGVSQLVFSGYVKSTDAYLKIEDDIARVFLHLIYKIKFQKPTNTANPGLEVAV